MDKKLAQEIVRLRELHGELVKYALNREDQLKNELVLASDLDTVRKLQGAIQEVGKLKYLRDTIAKELDKGT